jgi:hypothetical protein
MVYINFFFFTIGSKTPKNTEKHLKNTKKHVKNAKKPLKKPQKPQKTPQNSPRSGKKTDAVMPKRHLAPNICAVCAGILSPNRHFSPENGAKIGNSGDFSYENTENGSKMAQNGLKTSNLGDFSNETHENGQFLANSDDTVVLDCQHRFHQYCIRVSEGFLGFLIGKWSKMTYFDKKLRIFDFKIGRFS